MNENHRAWLRAFIAAKSVEGAAFLLAVDVATLRLAVDGGELDAVTVRRIVRGIEAYS